MNYRIKIIYIKININNIGEIESIVMLDCFFGNVTYATGRARLNSGGEVGSVYVLI